MKIEFNINYISVIDIEDITHDEIVRRCRTAILEYYPDAVVEGDVSESEGIVIVTTDDIFEEEDVKQHVEFILKCVDLS